MSSQFRPLMIKPAPQTQAANPSEKLPVHQESVKKHRNRHNARAWEEQKDMLIELYCKQGKPLEEAKRVIEQRSGFKASVRQWKNKIRDWELEKNISASSMRFVISKRNKRAQDDHKETVFYYYNNEIDDERVDRFVRRQAKTTNLPSPPTVTPSGVTYYTPQAIAYPMSPNDDTNIVLASPFRRHYAETSPITTLKVNAEKIPRPRNLETGLADHSHQRADQGLACNGRFGNTPRALKALSQSYNLGVVLHNILQQSSLTAVRPKSPATSSDPDAPLFWADPPDFNTISNPRLQLMLDGLKQSSFCWTLVALSPQDRSNWAKEWRQMSEADGSKVANLATSLFGDTSLPYRGARFVTIWIEFRASLEQDRPMLLRVLLGVDLGPRAKDCQYCHSAFMILDFVDRTGAVKINIPLMSSPFRRIFPSSEEYLKTFSVKTGNKMARWSELTHLYQGWSFFCPCGHRYNGSDSHCSHRQLSSSAVRESDTWDPNADAEQSMRFEPYPVDHPWYIGNDISSRHTKWVEGSSVLDDDSKFVPRPSDEWKTHYFDPFPSDEEDQSDHTSETDSDTMYT